MEGTVLATLGEGRFGKVVCMRRIESNALVAVKHYDRQKATDLGRVTRILQEKSVLQLLHNPYITRYIETAKDESSLYIVMEAVLGGPLHRHIQLHGKLPLPIVQIYLAQLISCCEHMAKKGCIHRDIKASNCVLNEKGHIKLCDFGCAKVLFPTADFHSVVTSEPTSGPRTLTFLGSHHIMPIEMLQGSGYGVSVDWWAVGVLVFEMVTGTPPFDNKEHLVQENPSSTLHEYNWDIPFATTPPFDALEAATATATATGTSDEQQYSTEKKLLYDLKQLISDLLHPDIACRSGIWNIHKMKNSNFLSNVDFSFIDQGICSPVAFDKRVGYLEILCEKDDNNSNAQDDEEVSEKDQQLFDVF